MKISRILVWVLVLASCSESRTGKAMLPNPVTGENIPLTRTTVSGGWNLYQTSQAPGAFLTLEKSKRPIIGVSDSGHDKMITLFGNHSPDFVAYDLKGDGHISKVDFFDDGRLYSLQRVEGKWQLTASEPVAAKR